jgi:hypothetical protein
MVDSQAIFCVSGVFMNKSVTCSLFLTPSLSSWTVPLSFGQAQATVKLIKVGGLGGLQGSFRPFAVDFDRNQLLRVAEDRGMMAGLPTAPGEKAGFFFLPSTGCLRFRRVSPKRWKGPDLGSEIESPKRSRVMHETIVI